MSLPRDEFDGKRIPFQKPQQIILHPAATAAKQNNSTNSNQTQKYFHSQTQQQQHRPPVPSKNKPSPHRPSLSLSSSSNPNKGGPTLSNPSSSGTTPTPSPGSSRKNSQQSSGSQKNSSMSDSPQKPAVVVTSGKLGSQQQESLGHHFQSFKPPQQHVMTSQDRTPSQSPHKISLPQQQQQFSKNPPPLLSDEPEKNKPKKVSQPSSIIDGSSNPASSPPPRSTDEELKTENFLTSSSELAKDTQQPPLPVPQILPPPEKNVLSAEEQEEEKQRHAEYKYKKKHNLIGNRKVGVQGSFSEESEDGPRSEINFTQWTPPNLEVLTDVKMVTVRQQEDEQDSVVDIDMLGFDSHNFYQVFDETTTPKLIFYAVEKTDRQLKQKGQKRLYLIEIHALDGERVLTLERSQASFMGDGIKITLADGTFLGGIKSGCTCVCCSAYFDVFDSSRTTLLYIEDRGWCSREFAVVSRQDKTNVVAYLSKRFLDNVQESRSDADVYLLEIRGSPDAISPAVKTLLMCAVFFIDFKYFEDIRIKETDAKKKTSKKTINSTSNHNNSKKKARKGSDESAKNRPIRKLRNINAILNEKIEQYELKNQQQLTGQKQFT